MNPAAFLSNAAVYVLPFLVVLTFIVTIHELGHFLMAKAFGTAIDRFSIGFGRAIASWRDRSGVEWRIGWMPLGGYVRFKGDADASSSVPDGDDLEDLRSQIERIEGREAVGRYFHFKPLWQRALVVAAGPAANFLLAIVLFAALFTAIGDVTLKPRVGPVQPGSAAARAGFQTGDLLTGMDGRPLTDFSELIQYVQLRAEQPIRFDLVRAGRPLTLTATPSRESQPDALTGRKALVGVLGIRPAVAPGDIARRRYGPVEGVAAGVKRTADIVETTVFYLGRLIQGRESGDQLGGPVRMAQISGALAKASTAGAPDLQGKIVSGGAALLTLAAVLSVGIGFMNLLPVPVLDGGHLLFYAYEAVARRPLGARVQAAGYRVGLALLLGFGLIVTFNDLRQLPLFKTIGGLFS